MYGDNAYGKFSFFDRKFSFFDSTREGEGGERTRCRRWKGKQMRRKEMRKKRKRVRETKVDKDK